MNLALQGLLAILTVSALAGGWLAYRKPNERPVQLMLFVGYFWLLAFVQMLLAATVYFVWQKLGSPALF